MNKIFLSNIFFILYCINAATAATINVTYNRNIDQLNVDDFQALMSASTPPADEAIIAERRVLYAKVNSLFSIAETIAVIPNKATTNIILWGTNYWGRVARATLDWYRDNVFLRIAPTAMVWYTDLGNWCLFANQMKDVPGTIKEPLARGATIAADACPLVSVPNSKDRKVVQSVPGSRCRALYSRDFFMWLNSLSGSLSEKVLNLVRERPATVSACYTDPGARLGCSLRQLGYTPPLLNGLVNRDIYCLLPLLQFLEGIFYVYQICAKTLEQSPDITHIDICFLINMRDIIFYSTAEEFAPGGKKFGIFNETLQVGLPLFLREKEIAITVDFQPFVYGDDVCACPYKASGTCLKGPEAFAAQMQAYLPLG